MTTTAPTFEELHSWLTTMRRDNPVMVDNDQKAVQLFGYQDCLRSMMETQDFSSDLSMLVPSNAEFDLFSQGNFIRMDPPEHKNLRGLVSKAFTPKVIADLEPRITTIAKELLDGLDGEFDVVDRFTYPLPVIVIAELLGIPTEDRAIFRRWADVLLDQQVDGTKVSVDDDMIARITPTMHEMNEYLLAHIQRRRKDPQDDLTSHLTLAEAHGRRLTDQEIVGFVGLLLIAGHITTTALLGNSLLLLSEHPDIDAQLRADHSLVPSAVEEFLRFRAPFPRIARRTTRPLEIGGLSVPENYIVVAWLASANRDAAEFPEPDTIDITRSPNRHLTFAKGIHVCIGAPLARLEGRVALNLLLERYRELSVTGEGQFFNPYTMAAPKKLPMTGKLA